MKEVFELNKKRSAIVTKFCRMLEERWINDNTDEVWKIQDVPSLWREKTRKAVIEDGFIFLEDGSVAEKEDETTT